MLPIKSEEPAHAWAYLARLSTGTRLNLIPLIADYGAAEVAAGIHCGKMAPELSARGRVLDAWEEAKRDLERAHAHGARMLTPDVEQWPANLHHVLMRGSKTVPEYGGQPALPLLLWVRGRGELKTLLARSLAVVGTRAATAEGTLSARELGQYCAHEAITVVSGGALGIDSAAHRGSVEAGGATLCVMANGLDLNYPARNSALFESIEDRGLCLSEYAWGSAPHRHRFLARNRLIAALAGAVIVVEAAWRSGALNTAHWADSCGVPVGAYPGSVYSAESHGAHRLIRDGLAVLVSTPEQAWELAATLGSVEAAEQLALHVIDDPIDRRVHDQLELLTAKTLTALTTQCRLSAAQMSHSLTRLKERGLARELAPGRWIAEPLA